MVIVTDLKLKAKQIRRATFEMIVKAGKGHLGGSLSCVDILVNLFYKRIDFKKDFFTLSKGHACAALYAILADLRYFDASELSQFNIEGALLEGHPHIGIPGIVCNSGSLGNGLGIACGLSLAHPDSKVYVLMGDGECDEGSTYEALLFLQRHDLNNVIPIIDRNGLSATQYSDLHGIWSKFAIQTIKGNGISFMEDSASWHHRIPNKQEVAQARKELGY